MCVGGCIRAWQHVEPVFSLPPLSSLLASRYICGVFFFGVTLSASLSQYGKVVSVSDNRLLMSGIWNEREAGLFLGGRVSMCAS